MARDTLTVTDNRTGKTYELPIENGAIHAADLRKIRSSDHDQGLISFDPALRNTATCQSAITFVDGETGILRYRGYSIEELAEKSTYLEVAYLIFHGELPTASQFSQWKQDVADHYLIHQNITRFLDGFRYDAHPMGVLISSVAALSTLFPDASQIHDPKVRRLQAIRLLGQVPTLAAFAHRRSDGMPYAYPDTRLSYVGNFLNMMFRMTELSYEPDPVIERALDVLFILHADHEQACSTTTMRCVGSAASDPFCAAAAAAAGLYGRFHGEAYGAVLTMLNEIGTTAGIPAFLERVRASRSEPPGFGHRVYRTLDPRAIILRGEAEKVFRVINRPRIFDVAVELEQRAAREPYFVDQGLYPIVDYYEAILYHATGFPTDLFPVLFAMPRFIGWAAQWDEMMSDSAHRAFRPRQIYVGKTPRPYRPLADRAETISHQS
jgi:citrate synthase